jgi:uncharacterized membrane protein YedE/YeeE
MVVGISFGVGLSAWRRDQLRVARLKKTGGSTQVLRVLAIIPPLLIPGTALLLIGAVASITPLIVLGCAWLSFWVSLIGTALFGTCQTD